LSTFERSEFDDWLIAMVRDHGDFTVLVILTEIAESRVSPLCSTYFHVIGDEVSWTDIVALFKGANQTWDGAAFFPTIGPDGGPTDRATAEHRLRELELKVREDRMILNDGHFFDTLGRRIKIEPIATG
jgi:hypothetical protein